MVMYVVCGAQFQKKGEKRAVPMSFFDIDFLLLYFRTCTSCINTFTGTVLYCTRKVHVRKYRKVAFAHAAPQNVWAPLKVATPPPPPAAHREGARIASFAREVRC